MLITPLTVELLTTHFDSYLATLATLSPSGDHTPESLVQCFEVMIKQGTAIFIAQDNDGTIVGTISVLIEHKFNRGGSRVAHLEDLAVHPDAQGRGVGTSLMKTAISYAKEKKCYKIILDADKNPTHVHYYEKFGFINAGAYMKMNLL